VNLRETFYGPTSEYLSRDNILFTNNKVSTTAITDLEFDYHYLESWTIAFGANNLFDERPDSIVGLNNTQLSNTSNVVGAPLGISPFGINGGFYYTRITFNF
jgi:iron complex outermembrane receptor protein